MRSKLAARVDESRFTMPPPCLPHLPPHPLVHLTSHSSVNRGQYNVALSNIHTQCRRLASSANEGLPPSHPLTWPTVKVLRGPCGAAKWWHTDVSECVHTACGVMRKIKICCHFPRRAAPCHDLS